jgi:hypothetical protein
MHDRNGNPVKEGDRVRLEGDIVSTSGGEEYCNVTVLVTEKGQDHGPYNVQSHVTVNAKQTELVGKGRVALSKDQIRSIFAGWFAENPEPAQAEEIGSEGYLNGCTDYFFAVASRISD